MADTVTAARPSRIRFALSDDHTGATPLELSGRTMWPAGLIAGAMFAIFATVEWTTISRLSGTHVRDVFDLAFALFQGFWILGWSVGVVMLGLFTVLLCFYGESARLQNGQLLSIPRLGPVKIIVAYDLARIRNLRLEGGGDPDAARICFDDDAGPHRLGGPMPRADANRVIGQIERELTTSAATAPTSVPTRIRTRQSAAETDSPPRGHDVPPQATDSTDTAPPSLRSLPGIALVAANLVPLGGVLFLGWNLASVIVLYWAESAVIGFYTIFKIAIVGKWSAIFSIPFFIGHFGGFMAVHFLFIYTLFIRGINARGPAPAVGDALAGIFMPIWPALAGLFISHGVSFFSNFIGRREYATANSNALMMAPYSRIMVMQVTLIFGGWIILLLKNPVPALALLVLLKTAADFSAHRKEHG